MEPANLDSEGLVDRASPGENGVSLVSGEPLVDAASSEEPGLLRRRQDGLALIPLVDLCRDAMLP